MLEIAIFGRKRSTVQPYRRLLPSLRDAYVDGFYFADVGVPGSCAGQSVPGALSGGPQEARQPPVFPPEQQRLQLPGPHRELLRQDTYVAAARRGHLTVSRALKGRWHARLFANAREHCMMHAWVLQTVDTVGLEFGFFIGPNMTRHVIGRDFLHFSHS